MSSDISRILHAATFAADKHRDQRRKDHEASPFVNHPLAVAMILANHGGDTDVDLLIAALLHDTVEDTATTAEELTELFGSDIAGIVSEVTDDKSLPKELRKKLQIENAPHKTERAKQLNIADKICNVRDINASSPANWDEERKAKYLDWAVKVVAGCRNVNPQLDKLFDEAIGEARKRLT